MYHDILRSGMRGEHEREDVGKRNDRQAEQNEVDPNDTLATQIQ
jgi:hypothetical protein